MAFICFLLSFLLWLEANKDVNKKKKYTLIFTFCGLQIHRLKLILLWIKK